MKTNSKVRKYEAYGEIRRKREIQTVRDHNSRIGGTFLGYMGVPPYQFLKEFYKL